MTSDPNAGNNWDRVAAELRACREAQQRAWGDIDNTTLGRFLAGDVSSEEHQQIESALDELPELRKLTELVRDVLGESEAAIAEPAAASYGPTILPFPQPQAGPARGWRQRMPAVRFRQRAGLVAAATVLLALGMALPRSGGMASPQAESSVAMSQPVAFHGDMFATAALADDKEALTSLRVNDLEDALKQRELFLARIDASVQALEAEGKKEEAQTLARHYASNLARKAMFYQEKGDLVRAEPALNQARALCARTLGVEAPETVRTRNSLANVYEVALNTAPSSSYTLEAADSPNPYFAPAVAQRHPLMAKSLPPAAPSQEAASRNGLGHSFTEPAVRVAASAYGSPRSAPKSRTPGATAPRSAQPSMHHAYGKHHSNRAQQMAMIALRERITRQSQSELKTSVVPVLAQALREATDAAERQRLAQALGQLGPAARASVPVLLDCYHKATGDHERSAILLSLGQIGPAIRCCGKDLASKRADDPLVREVVQLVNSPEGRSGIEDECECFSVKALQQAQGEIHRLAKTYQVEILIETVPGPTDAPTYKAEDRQGDLGKHGIFLRIIKDAPVAQVYVSESLRKQGLTDARLRQVMEPRLRGKDFDGALRQGIRFLAQFEKEHSKK